MKKRILFISLVIGFFYLFSTGVTKAKQSIPVTWNGEFKTGTRIEEITKIKGEPDRKVGPVGYQQIEKWYYGKEVVVIMDGYVVDSFYISWQ